MGGFLTISYCFPYCFLEMFVGEDKALMEGTESRWGITPVPPTRENPVFKQTFCGNALSTQNDCKPEIAPYSSNFKILCYVLFKSIFKVCFLLEWCFIISVEVCSGHFQLKRTGFAGSHYYISDSFDLPIHLSIKSNQGIKIIVHKCT